MYRKHNANPPLPIMIKTNEARPPNSKYRQPAIFESLSWTRASLFLIPRKLMMENPTGDSRARIAYRIFRIDGKLAHADAKSEMLVRDMSWPFAFLYRLFFQ